MIPSPPTQRDLFRGLVSLSLLAAGCSATPSSVEGHSVPSASASATSPPAGLARAPRAYQRGEHVTPVVDAPGPFQIAAVSPDGLLVALSRRGSRSVWFLDTDRGRIVGQATALESGAPDRLVWRSDDALFVEGTDVAAQLDGRSGRLVARVSGARPGAIKTSAGWGVLIENPKTAALDLVALAHPETVLARLPSMYARSVLDLGAGRFAVASSDRIVGYDADGAQRWEWPHAIAWDAKVAALGASPGVVRIEHGGVAVSLSAEDGHPLSPARAAGLAGPAGLIHIEAGRVRLLRWGAASAEDVGATPAMAPSPALIGASPGGTVFAYRAGPAMVFADAQGTILASLDVTGVPSFGDDERPHAIIDSTGVYGVAGDATPKLVALGADSARSRIVAAGADGFAARCEGGSTATLGADARASDLGAAEGPLTELTTADGAFRLTWGEKLVITRLRERTTSELALAPIASVSVHPDGKTAIVASHLSYVGNAWIADPKAQVHFVDIASGRVRRSLRGDSCSVTPDGKRLIVASHEDIVLYDAETFRELRRWVGQGNEVTLDPTLRFALVFVRAKTGLGPLETTASFVEDLTTGARVVDLGSAEGSFAFDPSGAALAFTPGNGYPNFGEAAVAEVYDLKRRGAPTRIRSIEPIERVQFVAEGRVLAVFSEGRALLHRLADGREVTVHAIPDGAACRLFAVDDTGHFFGDPGGRLGLRFGDDLRTSEVVWAGPGREALHAPRLLAELFVAPAAPAR